jgi:hypothetical protein
MVDVDLNKTVKINVVPGSSLGLTQEKACGQCGLEPSKKKGYSEKEALIYCVQECGSKIRKGHENGKPFEIEIISIPDYYQSQARTQPKSKPEGEKIPPAPQDLFFIGYCEKK